MKASTVFSRSVRSATPVQWAIGSGTVGLLSAVATAVPVTGFLETDSALGRLAWLVSGVIIALVGGAVSAKLVTVRDSRFPDHPDALLEMLKGLRFASEKENDIRGSIAATDATARQSQNRQCLKVYLSEFEKSLSAAWSESRFGDSTPVEIVVMRRAHDGYMTVAAWTDKRPTSLPKRQDNPQFYENTEAAKRYREYVDRSLRAPIHLIGDVSKHEGYDHFGRDQLLRTNSTALFPLYDSQSKCWGFVAATARGRTGMFDEGDRKFWEAAWSLWEPPIVRCISGHDREGSLLDEGQPTYDR